MVTRKRIKLGGARHMFPEGSLRHQVCLHSQKTIKSGGMEVKAYHGSIFKSERGSKVDVYSKCFGEYGVELNVGDSASNGFAKITVISIGRVSAVVEMTTRKLPVVSAY
jgi:hypothetical protein